MKRKLFLLLCALLTSVGMWAEGYTDYLTAENGWTRVTSTSQISTDGSAVYVLGLVSETTRVVALSGEGSTTQVTTSVINGQPDRTQVWYIESDSYDDKSGYAFKSLANSEKYLQSNAQAWNIKAEATEKGLAQTCYSISIDGGTYNLTIYTNDAIWTDAGREWGWWNPGNPSADSYNLAGNKSTGLGFALYKKQLGVAGQDYTFLIGNPSFETGTFTSSWTNDGMEVVNNASFGDGKVGTYYTQRWNKNGSAELNQTIANLPAGIYKISANLISRSATCEFYANDERIPVGDQRNYSILVNLTSSGSIRFGLNGNTAANTSSWIAADNFTLTYYGDSFNENLSFDKDVQFDSDATGDWGTSNTPQIFLGWNLYKKDTYSTGAVFAYGTKATINDTEIPATAPTGSTSTAGLALTSGWQNTISYRSTSMTLPAGTYTLTYKVYNANTRTEKVDNKDQTTMVAENLTGFVTNAGTNYLARTKNFTKGAWTYEEFTFTLLETTNGHVQVGYKSSNVPSKASPILVFDGITIERASATNSVTEGKFFLYNVGAKKYLQGGNAYGTYSSLREVGLLCTLTAGSAAGTYKIATGINDNGGNTGYLGSNGYVDNGTAADWNFVEVSEGVYKLMNGSNYLYWSGSGSALTLNTTEPTTDNGYWTLVSKPYRTDALRSATSSIPVDASFLIQNPDFDRNHPGGWASSNVTLAGGDNNGYVGEIYNTNGSVTQTINDLPVGAYLVKVNGFYSNGTTFDQNLYLNVGDKTIVMPNILHEAKASATSGFDHELAPGKYVPNGGGTASLVFADGAYQRTMPVIVTGTSLSLGLSEQVNHTGDWSAFDRVRLVYYGNTAEGYAAVLAQLQSQATADLSDGFYTNVKGSERATLVTQSTATASTTSEYNALFGTVATAINNFERAKQAYDDLKAYLDEMSTYVDNENYPIENDDYEAAYDDAYSTYTTSTELTVSGIDAIKATLNAALVDLFAANGGSLAEPINMTAKIQNPDMAATTGWTLNGMGQHPTSQFGNVSTAPIIEKYSGSSSAAIAAATSCQQTLTGMRAGHYYLKAAVNATLQSAASPKDANVTGVNLMLGDAKTAINGTENAAGEIFRVDYDLIEAGELLIGFETTAECTANWVAWDNVELYYCGPSDTYATDLAAAVATNKNTFTTGVVKNFTFDDVTGWTGGTHQTSFSRSWKSASATDAFVERSATGVIYYTFSNMPAGNYKVVAAVRSYNGGRMTLSVANTKGASITGVGDGYTEGNNEINLNGVEMPNKGLSGEYEFTTNGNGHNWRWATATGTLSADGDLTVVFSTRGNGWMAIDDVTLYYLGDDEVVSYTKDATSVSNSDKTVTKDIVVSNPNIIICSDDAINGAAGVQINNNLVSETVANLVLYDGYEFSAAADFEATNATLYRSIGTGNFATICAPFAISGGAEGGSFYEPSSLDAGTLSFAVKTNPEAGNSYLFKADGAVTALTGSDTEVKASPVENGTGIKMTGTYSRIDAIDHGNYVLSGGKLYKLDSDVSLNPFRAYFNTGGNELEARSVITVNLDGNETAINVVEESKAGTDAQKDGKYLENGQIIIVKNGVKYSTNGQILK